MYSSSAIERLEATNKFASTNEIASGGEIASGSRDGARLLFKVCVRLEWSDLWLCQAAPDESVECILDRWLKLRCANGADYIPLDVCSDGTPSYECLDLSTMALHYARTRFPEGPDQDGAYPLHLAFTCGHTTKFRQRRDGRI